MKLDGTERGVDWELVDRARQLTGLKGYVTNIDMGTMDGQAVITAYHDLWKSRNHFGWPRPIYEPGRYFTDCVTRSKPTSRSSSQPSRSADTSKK